MPVDTTPERFSMIGLCSDNMLPVPSAGFDESWERYAMMNLYSFGAPPPHVAWSSGGQHIVGMLVELNPTNQ